MNLNARVTKPRTRSARLKSSKAALEKLDAVVRDRAGLSSRRRQQSAKSRDCAWTAPPVHSVDSHVDPSIAIIPSPEDRASVTWTNLRQLVEDDKPEQAAKPIQQPKPLPRKRPHASFLADTVDQLSSNPDPKRYRPESVDRFVTQWVESVSVSESYRERHCRSDSLLNHSDGDLISRRLTQSVPSMVKNRASTKSRSNVQSVGSSDAAGSDANTNKSEKSLVLDPLYRSENLHYNHIFKRSKREKFPEHIRGLIDLVSRDRDSPEPSLDIKQQDELEMLANGAGEPEVQSGFRDWIFFDSRDALRRSERMRMWKHAVPSSGSEHKVSIPHPDMLFGYVRDLALPQHFSIKSLQREMTANSSHLAYPFLDVEFKGDGALWVATNQCLGGAASCVNLTERLNDRLKGCKNVEIRTLNSAAFSVAMNGTEARLYISWKHDKRRYYLQEIMSFAVQQTEQYLQFRQYIRNIFDWGMDQRLQEIRDSLDKLIEENRKRASAVEYGASDTVSDDDSNNSDPEEVWCGNDGQEEEEMQIAAAISSSSRKAKRKTSVDGRDNGRDAAKKKSKPNHASKAKAKVTKAKATKAKATKAKATKAKRQARACRNTAVKAADPPIRFLRSTAARAKAKRAVS
ncbi:hypothetical protein MMC07_000598 [Pseudocyphellaria aurata]|nr:hypothetical protein [Pseudocyphellaria aurata]